MKMVTGCAISFGTCNELRQPQQYRMYGCDFFRHTPPPMGD